MSIITIGDFVNENKVLTILIAAWLLFTIYLISQYIEKIKLKKISRDTKDGFFDSLDKAEQNEFHKLFMGNPKHLENPLLIYKKGANNRTFFELLPHYLYDYRRQISFSLLEKMYEKAIHYAKKEYYKQNFINESFIRIAFFMRKEDEAYLNFAEKLCRIDVDLSIKKLQFRDTYIYSCRKLAVILELTDRYDEAIQLCKQCISLGISDGNVTEYEGRLNRLLAVKNREFLEL